MGFSVDSPTKRPERKAGEGGRLVQQQAELLVERLAELYQTTLKWVNLLVGSSLKVLLFIFQFPTECI